MKIIFAFLLFISFKANCQISPPVNNHEKFKGAIKSYQENQFSAIDNFGELIKNHQGESFSILLDENNNPTKAFDLNNEGKETFSASYLLTSNYVERIGKKIRKNKEKYYKEYWKYDISGNITEHCKFYNDTLEEKEISIYNAKNKLVEYKSYGKDGKLDWQKSLKYDLNGNEIESLMFNSAGYYDHNKFNYNIKNKVIESFSIDRNDKIKYKKTYKYDKNENVTEELINYVNYEEKKFNGKTLFQYSNKGKITSEIRYNSDGAESYRKHNIYDSKGRLIFEETPYGKHTYSFDLLGNLIEEIDYYYGYDGNKNLKSKSLTKFEYDSKGNWIKKIHSYIESPKIIPDEYTITERIINYR